jgi:osmotically inducible lipoprotein OsmB
VLPSARPIKNAAEIVILTENKLSFSMPVAGIRIFTAKGDRIMAINSAFKRTAILGLVVLGLGGCSNMDQMQQQMLSGGAIGVTAGALTTVVTGGCVACGMAIGGAVGTAGGYLVHELDANTRSSDSSPPPPIPSSYNSSSNNVSNVPQGYPPGGYSQN